MEKLNTFRVRMLSSPLAVALLFTPFFKPYGLVAASLPVAWVFVIWKALAMIWIGMMFLSRPKISLVTALMGVYQALLLVSTAAAHGEIATWAYDASSAIAFFLLMELGVGTDIKCLMKGIAYSLGTLCLINLVTVLLAPGGYYLDMWFFIGTDNANCLYLLPMLGIALILAQYSVKRPLPLQIGLLAVFSASLYITWSAASVVSVTAFIVLVLLQRVKKSGRVFNIGVYYGLICAAMLLIVIFRVQNYFAFLIEDVLHKDISLTDRVPLWDTVMGLIRERPVLGYGLQPDQVLLTLLEERWHCHNLILQRLFESGILGTAVYLAMLGCVVRPLMKRREHPAGYFLAATIFALLLDSLVEALIYPMPFYAILLLSWYVDDVAPALEPVPEK